MWMMILNWFSSGVLGKLLSSGVDLYKAKLAAGNTTEAHAVDLAVGEIRGEIALRQTEASILRSEQGWWVTAMIRPLFAAPFIIFTCKVIIYDKCLGWGTTDALDTHMWGVYQIVVTGYFGARTIEKVARIFKGR